MKEILQTLDVKASKLQQALETDIHLQSKCKVYAALIMKMQIMEAG